MQNKDLEVIFTNIVGEIDAIKLYEEAIEQTGDANVIGVFTDIRNEEVVHLGELFALALKIAPKEAETFLSGCQEAQELISEITEEQKRDSIKISASNEPLLSDNR